MIIGETVGKLDGKNVLPLTGEQMLMGLVYVVAAIVFVLRHGRNIWTKYILKYLQSFQMDSIEFIVGKRFGNQR